MAIAAHHQVTTHLAVLVENLLNVKPQLAFRSGQEADVAEEEETVTGARQGDADSIGRLQEAHHPLVIVPHQRQDDNVVLLALVIVHRRDVDVIERSQLVLLTPLGHHESHLGGVGDQDGDPLLADALLRQEMGQSEGHGRFVAVQVTGAAVLFRFGMVVIEKEDAAFDGRDARVEEDAGVVLQMAVDGRNDETGHFGTHSVLDGQHDGRHTSRDESFEKGHVHLIFLGQFVDIALRS